MSSVNELMNVKIEEKNYIEICISCAPRCLQLIAPNSIEMNVDLYVQWHFYGYLCT